MLTSLILAAALASSHATAAQSQAAAAQDATYRQRYPLPGPTFGEGWGVNLKSPSHEKGEIEQIRKAGFRWVRLDLRWDSIERERGVYDFAKTEALMRALKASNVRPVLVLTNGNDLYAQGAPRTLESRAAFCRFAEAALEKFKGRGVVWEIWNQPNVSWTPAPNVREYIELARAVGDTIRRVAPEEWYVGPASSKFDRSFIDTCLRAGLLRYWDAVTVHPNRTEPPESTVPDWDWLRQTVARYAPATKTVSLWSGAWGYSDRQPGLNAQIQGQYLVRQVLTNLACRVPVTLWSDWKDDRDGLVDSKGRQKPAYKAAEAITRELAGWTYVKRIEMERDSDWILEFRNGERRKYVGWTSGKTPTTAAVPDDSVKPMRLTPSPALVKPFERK